MAQFTLLVDNNSGSEVVATLDVVTGYGANVLASRQIRRNEFVVANQWQTFTVPFDNPCFGLVEARVWWTGNTNTKFSQLMIAAVNSLPSDIRWQVTDQLGTPRMIFDSNRQPGECEASWLPAVRRRTLCPERQSHHRAGLCER